MWKPINWIIETGARVEAWVSLVAFGMSTGAAGWILSEIQEIASLGWEVLALGALFFGSVFTIAVALVWSAFMRSGRAKNKSTKGPQKEYAKALEQVRGKSYKNETVIVDGKHFEECEFENVTFVFQGGYFVIGKNKLTGNVLVSTDIGEAMRMLGLMRNLNLLAPGVGAASIPVGGKNNE